MLKLGRRQTLISWEIPGQRWLQSRQNIVCFLVPIQEVLQTKGVRDSFDADGLSDEVVWFPELSVVYILICLSIWFQKHLGWRGYVTTLQVDLATFHHRGGNTSDREQCDLLDNMVTNSKTGCSCLKKKLCGYLMNSDRFSNMLSFKWAVKKHPLCEQTRFVRKALENIITLVRRHGDSVRSFWYVRRTSVPT